MYLLTNDCLTFFLNCLRNKLLKRFPVGSIKKISDNGKRAVITNTNIKIYIISKKYIDYTGLWDINVPYFM